MVSSGAGRVSGCLGLFSVLVGLAVADIAYSFHRIGRSHHPIVRDPLALLAALYARLTAIGMWFDLWGVREVATTRRFHRLGFAILFGTQTWHYAPCSIN